jgi:RNA polymerase sigma factor (sigma-70 family)
LAHEPRPEAALIARAQEGDREAYAELVRRYQDVGVATAFLILRDRHDAEDAVQEAFTNAFLALGRFRPDGSFRPWLLRIVANEARTIRGASRRRAEIVTRATNDAPTGATPSAEVRAIAGERREALLRALLELPEADRLVVTYRYFFDLGEAEMAEVLGVARGTIKSRLSRALAHLRPILRDFGPLVLVGPVLDDLMLQAFQELRHTPLGHPAPDLAEAALGHMPATAAGSRLHQALQHAFSHTTLTITAAVVGAALVATQARTALTDRLHGPPPTPAPAVQVIAYGGDLTDADRQALQPVLEVRPDASVQAVSRQELVSTLGSAPSDAAISSAAVTCQQTGLNVRTVNITRVPAAAYAGALLTAGMESGSVTVAAPPDKPVTGEAAIIGLLKAVPTCLGHPVDSERVQLAYRQLDVLSKLDNMNDGSQRLLRMLDAVLAGQPPDSVVQTQAADLDDNQRGALGALLDQLRGLDYGPYNGGFRTASADGAYAVMPNSAQ